VAARRRRHGEREIDQLERDHALVQASAELEQ